MFILKVFIDHKENITLILMHCVMHHYMANLDYVLLLLSISDTVTYVFSSWSKEHQKTGVEGRLIRTLHCHDKMHKLIVVFNH